MLFNIPTKKKKPTKNDKKQETSQQGPFSTEAQSPTLRTRHPATVATGKHGTLLRRWGDLLSEERRVRPHAFCIACAKPWVPSQHLGDQ